MRSILFLVCSVVAFGQITFPTTTLTQATTAKQAGPLHVASVANIFSSANQYPGNGSIGDPTGPGLTILLMGQEAACVLQVYPPQLSVNVIRGCQGTWTQNHSVGDLVYAGPAWYYKQLPPSGTSCTASQQTVLPWIVLPGGEIWNCTNGAWVLTNPGYTAKAPAKKHWYQKAWGTITKPFKKFARTYSQNYGPRGIQCDCDGVVGGTTDRTYDDDAQALGSLTVVAGGKH